MLLAAVPVTMTVTAAEEEATVPLAAVAPTSPPTLVLPLPELVSVTEPVTWTFVTVPVAPQPTRAPTL